MLLGLGIAGLAKRPPATRSGSERSCDVSTR